MEKYICFAAAAAPVSSAAIPRMAEELGVWHMIPDFPTITAGIDLVKLKNGDLVLVYNPRENLPGYYKGPRTPLSVALSRDNGETFEIICTLEDQRGDYCYPSVICNDDNKIMITYTWKREKIVYVSFTLEDCYEGQQDKGRYLQKISESGKRIPGEHPFGPGMRK